MREQELLARYARGPIQFTGADQALYERHLTFDRVGPVEAASTRDKFEATADLASYRNAQRRLGELYADREAWQRKAILNIAASGRFSSDRTIADYAREIWRAQSCPIES